MQRLKSQRTHWLTNKNFLLLLVGIITFPFTVNSQAKSNADFVVLHTGDTLFGKVSHINTSGVSDTYYKKIRLTELNGKRRKISRKKICAFRSNNMNYEAFLLKETTRIFRFNTTYSIENKKGKRYFLKVISKGELSHYQLEWMEQGSSNIQSMDLLIKTKDHFFIRATQGIMGIKSAILIEYFADCPSIQSEISKKKLSTIHEITNYYNRVCKS
jgi:hypothetical protein